MPVPRNGRSFREGFGHPAARAAARKETALSGMSAIPGNAQLESDDSIRLPRQKLGLPLTAILYGGGVMVVALAVAAPAILRINGETRGWATFAILAAGASVAQLYVVRTARDTAFHTTVVFV